MAVYYSKVKASAIQQFTGDYAQLGCYDSRCREGSIGILPVSS